MTVDTTWVSPLHCDKSGFGVADIDGGALVGAHREKEHTNLELVGPRRSAQLVGLVGEVGGDVGWYEENRTLLRLVEARARANFL